MSADKVAAPAVAGATHDPRVIADTLSDGSKVYSVKIEATYQTGPRREIMA